jgi:hypothetical protein
MDENPSLYASPSRDDNHSTPINIRISSSELDVIQKETISAVDITTTTVQISPAPEDPDWVVDTEQRTSTTYGGPLTHSDIRDALRWCCCLAAWRRRLPISLWITSYGWKDLQGDLIAGVTVGLTVIPQALAYSQIAELPLEVRKSQRRSTPA